MQFLMSMILDLNKQIVAVQLGRHTFCVDVKSSENLL